MPQTRAEWRAGMLHYYDEPTQERVDFAGYPHTFYDDFDGVDLAIPAWGAAESGCKWAKMIVGAGPPTVAKVADAAAGQVACTLTADDQKQDAGIGMDDCRNFDITKGLVWEARVRLSVLPTANAEAVFGVIGDWADGPDAITYNAFFTADGSGEVFCETDDNATDASATSGVTALATDWKIYRIDFTDVTNILFYIDGNHVAIGTTFGYVATGANAVLQPYLGLYKVSGTGVGTMLIDYVRIASYR